MKRLCTVAEGIDLLGVLLQYGNQNAVSDIGVGMFDDVCRIGSGIFNVLINLQSITDEAIIKISRKGYEDERKGGDTKRRNY
ncbi:Formiminotransferase-cyclodeaminase [Fusobacterium necrophorum subsp. necrophorum]|nr:Formiminotransferase-cyclodeaminase [Fusobacterium necrophorum subsp. necrophorum]